MALETYSELQAAIILWALRSGDDSFEEAVPIFIKQAHKRIGRALRISDMETRVTGTLNHNGEIALPADYLGMRSVIGSGVPLTLLDPDFAEATYASRAGSPSGYTITGMTLKTYPVAAEADLEMVYYAAPEELSDDAPTNWLLTKAPDLYLYGALIDAAVFMMEDQRALTWGTLFEKALKDTVDADKMARWSRISARVKGYMP